MKRSIAVLFTVLFVVLTACSKNLTDKNDIISLYQNNEAVFLQAVNNADHRFLEKIRGIQKVLVSEDCVDIQCGGAGFGPGTHYYGIFYSPDDDLCAIDVAGPRDRLVGHGDGWLYQQENGDNRYYVEPLGDHFYYYEAHF